MNQNVVQDEKLQKIISRKDPEKIYNNFKIKVKDDININTTEFLCVIPFPDILNNLYVLIILYISK